MTAHAFSKAGLRSSGRSAPRANNLLSEKGNHSTMLPLHEQATARVGMTFLQMVEKVRYEGAYPTRQRAEDVIHAVLAALGRQLTGDERVDLAARLPAEFSSDLTRQMTEREPLTGWGFVKDLAARTGGTPATARWDAGAVLAVTGQLAGPGLLDRIITQLPPGYALLFGRVELIQAA